MDGYLDQQVPYTLANVRMDEHFFFLWTTQLPGFIRLRLASARLLAEEAAACAR